MKKYLILFSTFFAFSNVFAGAINPNPYCPKISTDLYLGVTDKTTNGQVTELQKFIKSYYNLSDQQFLVSGVYGNVTKKYINFFQKQNNLRVAGTGEPTRNKILAFCKTQNATSNSSNIILNNYNNNNCVLNNQNILNNSTVVAYQNSLVSFGNQCVSEIRKCTNGNLSGSFTFPNCFIASQQIIQSTQPVQTTQTTSQTISNPVTYASCNLNGSTVAHGSSVTAYLSSLVSSGQSCVSEVRTCTNGNLSGTFTNPTCSVQQPVSVTQSSNVTAYDWTNQINAGISGWDAVAISANGMRMIGSSRDNKISLSTDGGANWQKITLPNSLSFSNIVMSTDGMKMIGTGNFGNLYTSTDGGYTWNDHSPIPNSKWGALSVSGDGTKILAGDIAPASGPGSLWRSVDGGNTWNKVNTGASDSACNWWTVSVSSLDGNRLVAGKCQGNLMISSDGGATWTALSGVGKAQWGAIAGSGDLSTLVIPSSNFYTWISVDSGITWNKVLTGIIDSNSHAWSYAAMSSDGNKIVVTADGTGRAIYTSSDHGATWTAQMKASNNGQRSWNSVAMNADGSKIIAGDLFNNLFTANSGTLNDVKSDPSLASGAVWSEHSISSDERHGVASVVSSSDGYKLAAVSGDGNVYTSTDAGANWSRRSTAQLINLTSSADGTKLAGGQYGGYIYTSSDGGATWTKQIASGNKTWASNGIVMSADGTKLSAIDSDPNGNVYISKDSGATWTPVQSAGVNKNWYSITMSNDGTKILAAGPGLQISLDGGNTWTAKSSASCLVNGNIYKYSGDGSKIVGIAAGGNTVCISTDDGNTWKSILAADAGQTWNGVAISYSGNSIAALNNINGYIYISRDGGNTWTKQTGANIHNWMSAAFSQDGNKIVAGAASYQAIFTSDLSSTKVLGVSTFNFKNNMQIGSTLAPDVTELQKILIKLNYLDADNLSGYFGPKTKEAVIKYQKAKGISPASGAVYEYTREMLNR